jgi:RecB family exonuclease
MSFLSASNLSRIITCPPSAFLPKEKQNFSRNAAKGTNIHAFVNRCIELGEDNARQELPARMNGKAVIDRLQVPEILKDLSDIRSEVALRWDAENDVCYVLGENIGRNYYKAGAKDYDIVGSVDIIATNNLTGNLVVIDVKTGMQVVEAITSEQLQALAFMVARSMGYSGSVETRISKINEDGTVDSNFHTITPEELSILELKFKGLRNKVLDNLNRYKTNEPLDLRESDHCKWCACAKHCPLKNAEPCLYIREDVEETK